MWYGEMKHPSHSHTLRLQRNGSLYICNGCKQPGFDEQYACEPCGFHLHKHCASPDPTVAHPIFKDCVLRFSESPRQRGACSACRDGGGCHSARVCDACGDDISGYNYSCQYKGCDVDLHPCCAKLTVEISLSAELGEEGMDHLSLRKESPVRRLWPWLSGRKCLWCQRRKPSRGVAAWSYLFDGEEGSCCLHISCAKRMLLEIWEEKCRGDAGKEVTVTGGRALRTVGSKLQVAAAAAEKKKKNRGGVGKKPRTIKGIVKMVLVFIIAAVVGDPTALLVGILTSLITH